MPQPAALQILDPEQSAGVSRGGLSVEPADAEPSAQRRRTGRKSGAAAGFASLQRRHHSLDARRPDHHRSGRPIMLLNRPARKSPATLRQGARQTSGRFHVPGVLASRPGRATAIRWRSAKKWNSARPTAQQRFLGISISPLRTGESGHRLRLQLSGSHGTEAPGAGSGHQRAHGRARDGFPPPSRMRFASRSRPWPERCKELGGLLPLEEDEKHLVEIVSRESRAPEPDHHRLSELFAGKKLRVFGTETSPSCSTKP